MSIGMTYEQFWFDSPTIRYIFDRVYEQKLALKNQDMWLQGLYNYRAFDNYITKKYIFLTEFWLWIEWLQR